MVHATDDNHTHPQVGVCYKAISYPLYNSMGFGEERFYACFYRPWSITYTSAEHNEYRNDALWFKTLAPLVDGAHHFMIYNFWW